MTDSARTYKALYDSPVGKLVLICSDSALIELEFESPMKDERGRLDKTAIIRHNPVSAAYSEAEDKAVTVTDLSSGSSAAKLIRQVFGWLDRYFAGGKPAAEEIPTEFMGSAFQKEVWEILKGIPYGSTLSYGEIARIIAKRRGTGKMSAQAVGGAVSRNPVCIIVPCHRVIGTDGSLTGFASGIMLKEYLLRHEGIID